MQNLKNTGTIIDRVEIQKRTVRTRTNDFRQDEITHQEIIDKIYIEKNEDSKGANTTITKGGNENDNKRGNENDN